MKLCDPYMGSLVRIRVKPFLRMQPSKMAGLITTRTILSLGGGRGECLNSSHHNLSQGQFLLLKHQKTIKFLHIISKKIFYAKGLKRVETNKDHIRIHKRILVRREEFRIWHKGLAPDQWHWWIDYKVNVNLAAIWELSLANLTSFSFITSEFDLDNQVHFANSFS